MCAVTVCVPPPLVFSISFAAAAAAVTTAADAIVVYHRYFVAFLYGLSIRSMLKYIHLVGT